jgi:hypothetical protein
MGALIDIQMPIKQGSYVRGDVIGAFLNQTVDWVIYINAKYEDPFSKTDEDMLKLTSESPDDMIDIKERIRIARKRNELMEKGINPYVYLADADVLMNDNQEIFWELIMGLERHPRLGAVGLPYQSGYHVGAGSMMLRRIDLPQIGDIRGAGSFCTCGYITHRLLQVGLFTVPLKTIRAEHLKMDSPIDNSESIKQDMPNNDSVEVDSNNNIHIYFTGGSIYHKTKGDMKKLLEDKLKENMGSLSDYKLIFHPLPSN